MAECKAIISQIIEIYGRLIYTHKTYEKCYEICVKKASGLKLAQIILSGLTTFGVISTIVTNSTALGIISSIISAIDFIITVYLKENDLNDKATNYGIIANSLVSIKEKWISLLSDYVDLNLPLEKVSQRKEEIFKEQTEILSSPIKTTNKGYKKAKKAIQQNKECSFDDFNELKDLLPVHLRGLLDVSSN